MNLFNKLSWIPFYEQCKIDKCSILYKRIHNNLPSYLGDHFILNNVGNVRITRGIRMLILTLFAQGTRGKLKADVHF